MTKLVYSIRLTHCRNLDNQSLGFIPDIYRILTKYALHHVLDRYLSDGVFLSKCAWKRIIYEKSIQRSNSELFHECVENYPACAPLILHSDGVSCIWTMTRHCQELSTICRRTLHILVHCMSYLKVKRVFLKHPYPSLILNNYTSLYCCLFAARLYGVIDLPNVSLYTSYVNTATTS